MAIDGTVLQSASAAMTRPRISQIAQPVRQWTVAEKAGRFRETCAVCSMRVTPLAPGRHLLSKASLAALGDQSNRGVEPIS